jgi:hypothetical protein
MCFGAAPHPQRPSLARARAAAKRQPPRAFVACETCAHRPQPPCHGDSARGPADRPAAPCVLVRAHARCKLPDPRARTRGPSRRPPARRPADRRHNFGGGGRDRCPSALRMPRTYVSARAPPARARGECARRAPLAAHLSAVSRVTAALIHPWNRTHRRSCGVVSLHSACVRRRAATPPAQLGCVQAMCARPCVFVSGQRATGLDQGRRSLAPPPDSHSSAHPAPGQRIRAGDPWRHRSRIKARCGSVRSAGPWGFPKRTVYGR